MGVLRLLLFNSPLSPNIIMDTPPSQNLYIYFIFASETAIRVNDFIF